MTARPAGQPLPFQPGKPIGNVYYGACCWTDRTLIDAGTFYPPSVRTAADRLAHYASQFPIVEVDATYYALPSERNAPSLGGANTTRLRLQHQSFRLVHASLRRR
jgi:hypothetical protein